MRRPFSFNINCQFFLRKNMFFCLKIKLSIHACLLSLYNKINLRNNNWLLNYDCSCCSRTLSWHLHSSFFYHFPIARFCVSPLSILTEHRAALWPPDCSWPLVTCEPPPPHSDVSAGAGAWLWLLLCSSPRAAVSLTKTLQQAARADMVTIYHDQSEPLTSQSRNSEQNNSE